MASNNKTGNYLGAAILIAMTAGIAAGAVQGKDARMWAPLGDIFMQLIKMLVVPLVAVSIVSGAASIGNTRSAGKIGIAAFGYFLLTTIIASVIALALGVLFQPGIGLDMAQIQSMFSTEYAGRGQQPGPWEIIRGIIPENPVRALVDGNILQIIFFSILFGFGLSALGREKAAPVIDFFNTINHALIWIIEKVMYTAPLGVFGLMADAVGAFGYDVLTLIMKLLAVYVLALLVQTFGVYTLFVRIFSRVSPVLFFKKLSRAQIVALSTSSSMATLPVTMQVCEEDLGVSSEVSSFVLPLGATINMDGNSVYYSLAAVFFAQLFGVDIGPAGYAAIVLTATVGSIGQAGVPGPTLLVVAVLMAANIPLIGLPLLFGVDRLFDMLRTVVNITGDSSCAVIMEGINRLENGKINAP